MPKGSRLPGFHKAKIAERLRRLADAVECDEDDLAGLAESASLPLANADAMIENAVGVLGLPVGIGLNFIIDGEELIVPMAVEEPSVVAAVSLAAKLARAGGGFITESDAPLMIGQVQITQLADPIRARARRCWRRRSRSSLKRTRSIRRCAPAAAGLAISKCGCSRSPRTSRKPVIKRN